MNPDERAWGARLQRLSPRTFERLVATVWEVRGWRCGVSTPGADGGIDITARRSGLVDLTVAVQVKQYAPDRPVGVGTVREYAGLYRAADPPDTVCLVASCEFTATARSEAHERDVQLVDGHDLAGYCEAAEKQITGRLEEMATYLGDCPRTASTRQPSVRTGPSPIPGTTAVDGAANHTTLAGHPSSGAVETVLRRAASRSQSAKKGEIVVYIVPSLRSPDREPTTLRWSPPGTIRCRNVSPQARRNLRSVANRHPRARCSVDDETLTLNVAGGSDGDLTQLPRVILVGCLGVGSRDLISVVSRGDDETVIYDAGVGEGS